MGDWGLGKRQIQKKQGAGDKIFTFHIKMDIFYMKIGLLTSFKT
jgi:hypothetical protein